MVLSMEFPGSDPFAVAGNHGEVSGGEGISPARTPSESGGESDGGCLEDDEEVAEAEFQEAGWPDLPSPSRPMSDFFTDASDLPENQGFEEDKHVGGDSVETETKTGHSPPRLGHADSSSPENASVIDPSPRPWKKRNLFEFFAHGDTRWLMLFMLSRFSRIWRVKGER